MLNSGQPVSVPPSTDSTEWCLGLPLVGQRALSDAEITRLQRESGRLRGLGCLLGLASLPAFVVPVMLLAVFVDGKGQASRTLFSVIFIGAWLAFAFLFLKANDLLKRGNGLRRDLQFSHVKRFALPAGEHSPNLRSSSQQNNAEWRDIEVLPVSQRLWKVNGDALPRWRDASIACVAGIPSYVATRTSGFELPCRPLTTAEKAELHRYNRSMWLRLYGLHFFLIIWMSATLFSNVTLGPPIEIKPTAYFSVALLLWNLYNVYQTVPLTLSFYRDYREGIVNVITAPNTGVTGVTESGANDSERVLEVLPASGRGWTENGRPDAWRQAANQQRSFFGR